MHVPSNPRGRARRAVAALLLMSAGLAGVANAVDFDEKLKAPQVTDATAFHTQAVSYVARFASLESGGSQELITNRTLHAQRFDLAWQIQQAIDAKRPLGDLSGTGIEAATDGSYHIDFNLSPQWGQPEQMLVGILAGVDWKPFGEQLVARGFRAEDVATLKGYVTSHDATKAAKQSALPVGLAFSKVVKKLDRLRMPVADGLVLSYIYQRERASDEATREWAANLLAALDAQRARILMSYFAELKYTGVWAPNDQRAGIDGLLASMRLPDFEQRAVAEAGGTP